MRQGKALPHLQISFAVVRSISCIFWIFSFFSKKGLAFSAWIWYSIQVARTCAVSSAGRASAWRAGGHRFESCTVHHTVRTRTQFFTKKGSGTFFVYRRFCERTTRNSKRAKAGYHHDGGILPFCFAESSSLCANLVVPLYGAFGSSRCVRAYREPVHLWQGVTH